MVKSGNDNLTASFKEIQLECSNSDLQAIVMLGDAQLVHKDHPRPTDAASYSLPETSSGTRRSGVLWLSVVQLGFWEIRNPKMPERWVELM